ncbi:MAG: hypothetical protein Q8S33_31960 [Myxococcales bacterium]|nr:hypothetical protein [Myxococcales bacterium]MDP3504997.1 hypothetical protein [Myxococcales bacterium]
MLLLARVSIKLPAEAQVALAVIGAVLIGLLLIAWFVGTFGKKGLVAIGVTLVLFLVGVGVFMIATELGYREDARIRQEQARANAARLRVLLDARPTSEQPIEKACRAFIAPEPRAGASREQTSATFAWVRDGPTQEIVFVSGAVSQRMTLTAELETIDFDLERALRPEFFVVARKERLGSGWLVTLTVERDGATCTGSVMTKGERLPDDDVAAIGVCSRLGRRCGPYDKQFGVWF